MEFSLLPLPSPEEVKLLVEEDLISQVGIPEGEEREAREEEEVEEEGEGEGEEEEEDGDDDDDDDDEEEEEEGEEEKGGGEEEGDIDHPLQLSYPSASSLDPSMTNVDKFLRQCAVCNTGKPLNWVLGRSSTYKALCEGCGADYEKTPEKTSITIGAGPCSSKRE